MNWTLEEAAAYYRAQGAPADQTALVGLLQEIQEENGGTIPRAMLAAAAQQLGTKASFLEAVVKRFPRLRLSDRHTLELCAGPNCGKHKALAACAERLIKERTDVTLRFTPCMRMCGKGPNLKYDGTLFHGATQELLRRLLTQQTDT